MPRRSSTARASSLMLHPGAPLVVDGHAGGVGLVLTGDGRRPTHLLTAGHLFHRGDRNTRVHAPARAAGAEPDLIGRLAFNLLDDRVGDDRVPIDGALIDLTPRGRRIVERTPSEHFVASELALADWLGDVLALRPTTGAPSFASLTQRFGEVRVSARQRPLGYTVRDVLGTEQALTEFGDSGTLLVAADDPSLAVGLCASSDGSSTFLEPIARAVERACMLSDCDLQVWKGTPP